MSRGHGRIQQAILDHFRADPERQSQTIAGLTTEIGGSMYNTSNVESVRRACRRLDDEGLIEAIWQRQGGVDFLVVYLAEWADDPDWACRYIAFTPSLVRSVASRRIEEDGADFFTSMLLAVANADDEDDS